MTAKSVLLNTFKYFRIFYLSIFLVLLFLGNNLLLAQDNDEKSLQETLQTLSQDAASSYLSPISSAFGADLNAGWFHRVPKPKKVGFTFELGFVGMGAYFPDDSKSFSTSGQFRFSENEAIKLVTEDPNTTLTYDDLNAVEQAVVDQITDEYFTVEMSGATIIGSSEENVQIKVQGKTYTVNVLGVDQNYEIEDQTVELPVAGFKELADISFMPLITPQFTLGTVFGTTATFRWLPKVILQDDLGEFTYFGFGIQHNPQVFFPQPLPVDLAVGFFTQQMDIGTLFTTKTTSFGITASKQFGIRIFNVTPYAGFMFEDAKMRVKYDFLVDLPGGGQETIPVDFELDAKNKNRLTLGVNIMLLIFNLNADYNIGQYNSFSVGLHFAI